MENNEHDIDKSLQIPYHFTDVQKLKFVAYFIGDEEDAEPKEAGAAIMSLGVVSQTFYPFIAVVLNRCCLEIESRPSGMSIPSLIFMRSFAIQQIYKLICN